MTAPGDHTDERVLRRAMLRINEQGWGIAIGLVFGLGLFIATNILVLRGGESVGSAPLAARGVLSGLSRDIPRQSDWIRMGVRPWLRYRTHDRRRVQTDLPMRDAEHGGPFRVSVFRESRDREAATHSPQARGRKELVDGARPYPPSNNRRSVRRSLRSRPDSAICCCSWVSL